MKANNETFGDFLKRLRAKRRLSLQGAADESGMSKMYISQLENSKTANPTMRTMQCLAAAYHVNIKKMFDAWEASEYARH